MKKIVALVLSLVMVLGLATTAMAAVADDQTDAALAVVDADATKWNAKLVLEEAENAKDCEFAIYTIEMTAKVKDAPIFWGTGTADKGDDETFEVGGEDEFVIVPAAAAAVAVYVDGKDVTYLALASDYDEGWDEKATLVEVPYAVAGKKACDTSYAADPALTKFFKYDGALYTACALGSEEFIFNVGGMAVPAVAVDTEIVYNAHTYMLDSQGNTYGEKELTKVYCAICGKSFDFVVSNTEADALKEFGPFNYYNDDTYMEWNGELVWAELSASAAAGSDAATEGDKVESAETFDAGIAMYVGMSVMAAAGSAVVLKKKD